MKKAVVASLFVLFLPSVARAQSPSPNTVPVIVDNFNRAETDNYLATNAKQAGLGKFNHNREPGLHR